jgi:ribosomal protein L29
MSWQSSAPVHRICPGIELHDDDCSLLSPTTDQLTHTVQHNGELFPRRHCAHDTYTNGEDDVQSSGKVKAQALWGKNKDDLQKQLDELKQELVQLRTQKIAGGAGSKLNKMYVKDGFVGLE